MGAVAFAGLGRAASEEGISHTAEAIHQEPVFAASPKRLYEALLDAKQFDKVMQLSEAMRTGMAPAGKPTAISREEGGPFTIYGGHIIGRQLELVPGRRIVEAWRVVDWKPGIYSIARFELVAAGSGAKLIFDHTGFPAGLAQHLATGWNGNYWEPLRKFLAA